MAYRVLPIGLVAVSVLVAASIGLLLLLRGGAGGPDTALAVLPPIHYKCYQIPAQPPNPPPPLVTLQTQFGVEQHVPILQSQFLCPPAIKIWNLNPPQGNLNDPHLKCYGIQSTEDPPQIVDLTDQFGTQTGVAVGQAVLLCMPALKAVISPPPLPPTPTPGMLPTSPHYKCYQITGGNPGAQISLQTQFGTENNIIVSQAQLLCAPAIKTKETIPPSQPEGSLTAAHLKCYFLLNAGPPPGFIVNLTTQFGDETGVQVGQPQFLCQAVDKTVTFPTPTLTPTPTPSPTPSPSPTPGVCVPTPPWVVPAGDVDCDGFPSAVKVGNRGSEGYIGTLPSTACMANATPNNEPTPDAWPVDNNDDRKAGLSDILAYIPVFGGIVPPGPARFDINEDGTIGLQDVLVFIPFYNLTC